MKLPGLPQTLKRGVGRRILGLFMLAGLVPVLFTAGFAYQEIGRGLEQDISVTLRQHGKDYGLDVLARLQRLSVAADQLAAIIADEGADNIEQHQYLLHDIEAVWFIGAENSIRGDIDDASLVSLLEDANNASVLPRLHIQTRAGDARFVFVRRLGREPDGARLLVLAPYSKHVWGRDEDLPYAVDVCAFTQSGIKMHCSRDLTLGIHAELTAEEQRVSASALEWQRDGHAQLATSWQLFLAGEFGAPAIDIIASQPTAYAYQSRTDFRRIFIPALALVVVLIGLLSFNMIGRSLEPLRKLTTATRQVAAGNFMSRVRIRTGDEFEWLGDAFNNMASKLGRQIDTLEAMSNIDQLILSGSSFEQVSESVVHQLMQLTDFNAAGVIARDTDTPHWAKMISWNGEEFSHERIALPLELGHDWCQPRQVSLEEIGDSVAPYKERFLNLGMTNVVLIPVILNDDLKGILLLGAKSQVNLEKESLRRCVDLAGRFAVALASVEREEALYRQAHFDELTGLPNRQLLKDRLEQHIGIASRDQQIGALLYLDLDRFKEVNDVYGHSVGDIVLVQAAERIVREVRDSDTVARLGGDEFVIIMPNLDSEGQARMLATRLLERVSESFSVHGENHYVSASIGIVLFPDDGESVEMLLKNADAAMYRAKDAGRARFEFFSRRLNAESRRKINLERDLRAAYADNKLQVFYQPQFDMSTGIISGAEALLRWEHASEGFVSPAEFVPLAEDSDLIVDIGRWVIEQTCRDLQTVLNKGLHPGSVSINVSTRQLRDDRFVSDVLEPLRRFRIHPGYLQLEVTETTLAQNRDTVIDLLTAVRREGVRVAIDDFGTGYSSLSYLQHLPFDVIKIDKSFVDRLGTDEAADNICRTIIRMAQELGKKAIAEGAEQLHQIEFLRANGCNFVQGFYYSRPLPMSEFMAFVEMQDFHTQRRKALEIVK